jgi:TetR/AcrR family transcriptional regulator of autoinduction and epiphytic fitness
MTEAPRSAARSGVPVGRAPSRVSTGGPAPSSPAPDRRVALKERHRQAIIDAAGQLIAERGSPRFSVDELAARADVSRRTVFNHFASIDDVVLTVCTDVLGVVIDTFAVAAAATPVGDGSRASMFDEIAQTLRAADLVSAITALAPAVGPDNGPNAQQFMQEAFARTATTLAVEVERRTPGADPLDVELLVSSLFNGVTVIARHWALRTGMALDAESRQAWTDLLDHLISSVQSGYLRQP